MTVSCIDRYDGMGFLRVRADCVDQLTVDRIDRYNRRPLLRVRVDCVDQMTVGRIDRVDRYDRRGSPELLE